jgi:DNA-binding XRE family transcriptional regulator
MDKSINSRVFEVIKKFSNENQKEFALSIGVGATTINNIVSGRKSEPSYEVISKIINKFPQIDVEWFINGNGEMLKQKNNNNYNTNDDELNLLSEPKENYNTMRESTLEKLLKETLYENKTLSIENDRLKNKLEECEKRNGSLKTADSFFT